MTWIETPGGVAGALNRYDRANELIEVRVPGAVFYECFDPCATEFPREVNLIEPTVVKIGKGRQFRYAVTRAVALDMLDHAEVFGEATSDGVDDPSVGRAVVRWVARERARLGLHSDTSN